MQTETVRAKTFNIRFSDEEWARLDLVTEHYGITAAAVIRMLLKREADSLAREQGPATETAKPSRARRAKKGAR